MPFDPGSSFSVAAQPAAIGITMAIRIRIDGVKAERISPMISHAMAMLKYVGLKTLITRNARRLPSPVFVRIYPNAVAGIRIHVAFEMKPVKTNFLSTPTISKMAITRQEAAEKGIFPG